MSNSDKVVDLSKARHRKGQEKKEQKFEQLRDRFSKALGGESKPVTKGGLWKFKQKKKRKSDKPEPEGW
ncbi:MAG: hypothetical protein V7752_07560 [Halopseudomonas sp.]